MTYKRLIYGDNMIPCDVCKKYKSRYICASCRLRFYCSVKCRMIDIMKFHQFKCLINERRSRNKTI